ncbi:MAG: hypothetical protein ABFR95_05655 [Actinomycetota bacterium]
MQTVDWVVLIIGAAMIGVGAFGWLYTVTRSKPKEGAQTRSINPVEYVKALKDVPAPNLLIGLGALLVILAAGLVDIAISGG